MKFILFTYITIPAMPRSMYFILTLSLLLAACGTETPTAPTMTLPPPVVTILRPTETPAFTSTPIAAPTSTPLPHLMYPYTIAGLREREFSGGEISLDVRIALSDQFSTYLISYPSDGLRITGMLNLPIGEGPFPVIVMNHGFYPRSQYSSGDGSQRAAEFLTRRGYITISSDYRTWGGSDLGPSFFHTGLVTDVMNLLASLNSIPQADTSRVGMWGHSMGGGIATKILTLESPVSAAVLYAPNSADDADLIARWGYGCIGDIAAGELLDTCNSADVIPESLPAEVIAAYVESAQSPEKMREIAPYYHLNSISVPVQIHIGSADGDYIGSTPPEWSFKLHQGLLDAGANAELFVYEGQRHSFTGDAWTLFMERAAAFFDGNLK
ncbi:MAG: alpha/beta fold hydrolase [Chloroflexi bacterium]|nr:alpha/beta fold hydrolase [Chloroflexota bacterium]